MRQRIATVGFVFALQAPHARAEPNVTVGLEKADGFRVTKVR